MYLSEGMDAYDPENINQRVAVKYNRFTNSKNNNNIYNNNIRPDYYSIVSGKLHNRSPPLQCGHNTEILQMLTVFVRRVSSRVPAASDVLCELGDLLSLQDKNKDAHKCYSAALKTDPKCTSALVGTVSSHPGSNIIITAQNCNAMSN